MVDRQEVLAVHRDDDGVPDLRDEHLGLVLDFHVGRGEHLGVHPLREALEDVCGGQRQLSSRQSCGQRYSPFQGVQIERPIANERAMEKTANGHDQLAAPRTQDERSTHPCSR